MDKKKMSFFWFSALGLIPALTGYGVFWWYQILNCPLNVMIELFIAIYAAVITTLLIYGGVKKG